MKLSAPIYVLKNRAKDLKRTRNCSLSEALNEVARGEGFATWSLLVSKSESLLPGKYSDVLGYLNPGDLVLVAARPRMGKTVFTFGLIAQAISRSDSECYLFSLVEREHDLRKRLGAYNVLLDQNEDRFRLDCSNDICADYIIEAVTDEVKSGSLILVDYLQLLDEKRINPPVQDQILKLKEFAKTTGAIIIFLCQLDRRVGDRPDQRPAIDDIRLPNPLDLDLFNKIMFLHRESTDSEQAEVSFAGQENRHFKVELDRERLRFY